jgi:hypothetical protein
LSLLLSAPLPFLALPLVASVPVALSPFALPFCAALLGDEASPAVAPDELLVVPEVPAPVALLLLPVAPALVPVPFLPLVVPVALVAPVLDADAAGLADVPPEVEVPADAAGDAVVLELLLPLPAAGETLAEAFGEALGLAEALGDALALGEALAIGDALAEAAGDAAVPGDAAVDDDAPVCDE